MDWKEATSSDTLLDRFREGREKDERGSAHRVEDEGK